MRMGRYEEAFDCFEQALAIQPSDKYSLKGKGDVLVELGHYREALDSYKEALYLDPEMEKVKKALTQLREKLGKVGASRRKHPSSSINDRPVEQELEGLDEMDEE
jgi:tetratricopeptide (TPR) repeat protein